MWNTTNMPNTLFSTTQLLTNEEPIVATAPEDKLESLLYLPMKEERVSEGGLRTNNLFKKSYADKPLITVITVVYNGEAHVAQTILSVIEQGYDNVEYIIIDGGSTDGTLEIVKKYEEQIDYWVSEPDAGIYDAMNKGISVCTGDYVAFLNADDWYKENTLGLIIDVVLEVNPEYIFGDMSLYNNNKYLEERTPNLDKYKRYQPFGHQTLFVKKKYLCEIPFVLKYKIAADYDFMLHLIKSKLPFVQINHSLVNFRVTGISSEANYASEHFHILNNHFGISSAIYGYILASKSPLISQIIQKLVKIKHLIIR